MRNRGRIYVYETHCKRCGKPIQTTSRAITPGLDGLKARLGGICSDCTTPEEKQEMLEAIGQGMLKYYKKS